MPESEHTITTQDQLIALIALELGDSPAHGPVPTLEEIDQWRLKRLPDARAAEVLSHLARNNDCLRQLRQLEELDQIEATVPSVAQLRAHQLDAASSSNHGNASGLLGRFTQWLGIAPGPMLAGGLGFALLAVLVLPVVMGPADHLTGQLQQDYQQWASEDLGSFSPLSLNSKSAIKHSSELSQLRQGALDAVKSQGWAEIPVWKNWSEQLNPIALQGCGDADSCKEQTEFYNVLGRWFVAIFHDCESGAGSLDDFIATAKKLEAEGYLQSNDIGAALNAVANTQPAELCRLSADVLGL